MKKIVSLSCIAALVFFVSSSCKKSNNSSPAPQYNMQFSISAASAPLYIDHIVTGNAQRYYVKQCRFYVGYASLVKTDGSLVPLSNLFIVAYDSDNVYNAIYGRNFSFTVPAGSYTGVKFGIGIPPQIADTVKHYHYGVNDPLTDWGLFWPIVNNNDFIYRNIAIDMVIDTSKSQTRGVNREDIFHILQDDTTLNLFSENVYPDAFTVNNGDSHTTTLNLDFNNIFFNSTNPIDLVNSVSTDMMNGNTTQILLGEAINKNFYSSLSVK